MRANYYFIACLKNGSLMTGGIIGQPDPSLVESMATFRSWRGDHEVKTEGAPSLNLVTGPEDRGITESEENLMTVDKK